MPRKNKPGAGRPRKVIDEDQLEKMAMSGLTNDEMASILNVSDDTLINNYSGVIKRGRANLNMSLKRRQIKAAMEGNATMLIWVGKQYMGQKDRQDISHEDQQPVNITVKYV